MRGALRYLLHVSTERVKTVLHVANISLLLMGCKAQDAVWEAGRDRQDRRICNIGRNRDAQRAWRPKLALREALLVVGLRVLSQIERRVLDVARLDKRVLTAIEGGIIAWPVLGLAPAQGTDFCERFEFGLARSHVHSRSAAIFFDIAS
ncbi:hypothetical protein D3C86_1008200 [compost metagenome]